MSRKLNNIYYEELSLKIAKALKENKDNEDEEK